MRELRGAGVPGLRPRRLPRLRLRVREAGRRVIAVLRNLLHPPRVDDELLDDLISVTVREEVKQAQLREYRQGLADGILIFAKLALGIRVAKSRPYRGPELPEEFVSWARDAIARAEEEGGSVQ